jgi:hypothetical protein
MRDQATLETEPGFRVLAYLNHGTFASWKASNSGLAVAAPFQWLPHSRSDRTGPARVPRGCGRRRFAVPPLVELNRDLHH